MSSTDKSGDTITVTTGDVSGGQVAGGKDIHMIQHIGVAAGGLTPADREELSRLIADLKARVIAEAPAEKQAAALERVGELEETVAAEQPELSTLEYVRNWFVKNVPTLAGAVVSVVVNPIVGKVVAAAGDTLAADWRRRFNVT